MNPEVFSTFDHAALVALQARDIPRVRASDYFIKTTEAQTAEEAAETDDALVRWDDYFAGFAKLSNATCLCCGQRLTCGLDMGLFGGFAWGLAHGEGHCTYCRYPMRGHHQVDGLGTIRNLFLAYHPSTLAFGLKETP